jgi:hypothetical protein
MAWAPDQPPWMGDAAGGFPPMAYAYAPDGTPLLYAPDAPPAPYEPGGPPMGWPQQPGAQSATPMGAAPYTGPGQPEAMYTGPAQPEATYAAPAPPEAMHAAPPVAPSEAMYTWPAQPEAAYAAPAVAPSEPGAEPPAQAPQPMAPAVEPDAAVAPEGPPLLVGRAVLEPPQVTVVPDIPETRLADDAPPWPDFAPVNRVAPTGDGAAAEVERLSSAKQAHRLRLGRPTETASSVRTSEARLGRLHLRGGMLGLARASFEQLAGVETLDRAALADLAEARWRTGELEGAAEAAEAHIEARGDEPIARIIAAEQAASDGRILDARQLATQVQGQVGEGLERLFAGEPRSAVWPPAAPGWMDAGAALAGRFGLLVGGAEVSKPDAGTWPPALMSEADEAPIAAEPSALAHTRPDAAPFTDPTQDPVEAGRDADRELQAAERDLARGDLVALADRLGLLLRRDPTLAPVILSITEHALAVDERHTTGEQGVAPGPGGPSAGETSDSGPRASGDGPAGGVPGMATLQMLRGDILRGLGQDADATRAYQEALRALPGRAITREST